MGRWKKGAAATLTDRQREVFEFIRDLIRRRGYGPTVREIATQFGIRSPNGVVCHLKALERKGLIRRDANKARAIELTRSLDRGKLPADDGSGLPFAGVVPAGFTTHAFELDERFDPADLFNRRNLFVLRVQGDSMIDAHIVDGDYVICRSSQTAERGQMVVALNDENEATLKYWYPERNRIRLQPANSAMKPIYVRQASVRGIVVGVLRNKV
jgi:repressor LexA